MLLLCNFIDSNVIIAELQISSDQITAATGDDVADNFSKLTLSEVLARDSKFSAIINAIGFGRFIQEKELARLQSIYRMKYYYNPAIRGEFQRVLHDVFNVILDSVSVTRGEADIAAGSDYSRNVVIDGNSTAIFLMFYNGIPADAVITISDSFGVPMSKNDFFINQIDSSTVCTVIAKSDQAGSWSINIENKSNSIIEFNYIVNSLASDKSEEIALIISTIRPGEEAQKVTVNQEEYIRLLIIKGGDFLTGVETVNGAVLDANGNKIMDIKFVDDGDISKGDGKAMDGIYSTIIRFPSEGLYTIEAALEVKDLPLRTTLLSMTAPRGGFSKSEALGKPFNATFSRTASLSVVAGSTVEVLPIPTGMNHRFRDDEESNGRADAEKKRSALYDNDNPHL